MTYMKKIEKVLTSGKTVGEILSELKALIKQHDKEMKNKRIKRWLEELSRCLNNINKEDNL